MCRRRGGNIADIRPSHVVVNGLELVAEHLAGAFQILLHVVCWVDDPRRHADARASYIAVLTIRYIQYSIIYRYRSILQGRCCLFEQMDVVENQVNRQQAIGGRMDVKKDKCKQLNMDKYIKRENNYIHKNVLMPHAKAFMSISYLCVRVYVCICMCVQNI